jgi:hypothetical protein
VWKGKEKALCQLYGTWEESFKLLFRWKEAVLQKMPDSVIEIDIDEAEDGRLHFKSFFCALGTCLEGFHVGCRPYLSVDSRSRVVPFNAVESTLKYGLHPTRPASHSYNPTPNEQDDAPFEETCCSSPPRDKRVVLKIDPEEEHIKKMNLGTICFQL